MAREVKLELVVQVEDDDAKYIAVNKSGEVHTFKHTPRKLDKSWGNQDIRAPMSPRTSIENWEDTLAELPAPPTDWSKVPQGTKVRGKIKGGNMDHCGLFVAVADPPLAPSRSFIVSIDRGVGCDNRLETFISCELHEW